MMFRGWIISGCSSFACCELLLILIVGPPLCLAWEHQSSEQRRVLRDGGRDLLLRREDDVAATRKRTYTDLPEPSLDEVAEINGAERRAIKHWIEDKDIDQSIFGYGMTQDPKGFSPKVDADIGTGPIQHDFITWLGARMEKKFANIRYMEIGVAVLKSVHIQTKYFRRASITCVDIEDPNPTIANRWKNKKILRNWTDTSLGENDMRLGSNTRNKVRKISNYIAQYDGPNDNAIFYVTGDVFNKFTWSNLAQGITRQYGQMDLILSDGYHTGTAVVEEANNLIENGIIGNSTNQRDFALVWDDCAGEIEESVRKQVFPMLKNLFAGRSICAGSFLIGGWIGRNEPEHNTCVFTTLDISGPNMQASMSWIPTHSDVSCT